MADFTSRFNELLASYPESDTALAAALGVSKQTISAWRLGKRFPKKPVVRTIAAYFNVGIPWLLGATDKVHIGMLTYDPAKPSPAPSLPSNVLPLSGLHRQRVPLIGEVAAGEPVYAPEDCEVYVSSPVKCDAAVTVRGDSMIPAYQDGDLVFIRCCPDVDDGRVAVVFLDDEAAIKHVYHEPDGLLLLSDNPDYPPIRATLDDYPGLRVFGIPVGFTRMYKPDALKKIKKGL